MNSMIDTTPSETVPIPGDVGMPITHEGKAIIELRAIAKGWIDTAAQHLRNEEYLRKDRAELRKTFLDVLDAIHEQANRLLQAEDTTYDDLTLERIKKILNIAGANIEAQVYIKSRLEDEYPPNDKPSVIE